VDILSTAYLFFAFHNGNPFTVVDEATGEIVSEHPTKTEAYLAARSHLPSGAMPEAMHAYVIETDGYAKPEHVRTVHSAGQIEAHFAA
jgi:hypothetical protein